MPKLHELNAYYTYDMILDLIEMLDVKYAMDEERVIKQKHEMEKQKAQNRGR
jgi:hypothetical protein